MIRLLVCFLLMISADSVRMAVGQFLERWDIKGAQVAASKNNTLIFSEAFGMADEECGQMMGTDNLLRIASVSKLVTAIGIMKLEQDGKLSLDDKVFGEHGILSDIEYRNAIRDRRYYEITVEHLLRHEAGFRAEKFDPMFESYQVRKRYGFTSRPDSRTLLAALLGEPLGFYPGSAMEYSNVGYLILSLIIERKGGAGYEEWMRRNILVPCGCGDMVLGKNYRERRNPLEATYYGHDGQDLVHDCENPEMMVQSCYGGNDIEWLYGAGAWLSRAEDLCKLVSAADGEKGAIGCSQDILDKDSVRKMTQWYDKNTYSIGWNDTESDWTRTGTFSGTIALVYRFADGECWTLICNSSTWKGSRISRNTKYLLKMLHGTK